MTTTDLVEQVKVKHAAVARSGLSSNHNGSALSPRCSVTLPLIDMNEYAASVPVSALKA